ncbi:MAG: hydroxylamine reductase, partial [Verrucomicrobia bacterium]|nr:hydroxylamine reductase [Verrucomicrobiota bacterium]
MFCYQCEQTSKGKGCTVTSVCGKDEATANLQDLLLYVTQGIAQYAHRARALGTRDRAIDVFVVEALFTTVTNVNFDPQRVAQRIRDGVRMRDQARRLYESACRQAGQAPESLSGSATWVPSPTYEGLLGQCDSVSILRRREQHGEDISGLMELLTYGLKGAAAYADHALVLGHESDAVFAFFHEALDFLTRPNPAVDALLGMNLRCGEVNLKVMELLDAANTGAYGHPAPTPVRIHP